MCCYWVPWDVDEDVCVSIGNFDADAYAGVDVWVCVCVGVCIGTDTGIDVYVIPAFVFSVGILTAGVVTGTGLGAGVGVERGVTITVGVVGAEIRVLLMRGVDGTEFLLSTIASDVRIFCDFGYYFVIFWTGYGPGYFILLYSIVFVFDEGFAAVEEVEEVDVKVGVVVDITGRVLSLVFTGAWVFCSAIFKDGGLFIVADVFIIVLFYTATIGVGIGVGTELVVEVVIFMISVGVGVVVDDVYEVDGDAIFYYVLLTFNILSYVLIFELVLTSTLIALSLFWLGGTDTVFCLTSELAFDVGVDVFDVDVDVGVGLISVIFDYDGAVIVWGVVEIGIEFILVDV